MLYNEYVGWLEYLSRRPIQWRESLRAYTQTCYTAFSTVKVKPEKMFPELHGYIHGNEEDKKIKEGKWDNSVAAMIKQRTGHTWDFQEGNDDS